MTDRPASLTYYLFYFSAIYTVIMILLSAIKYGLDFDPGQGANIGMFIASGYIVAMQFVKNMKRAPSVSEKRKLSLTCTLAAIAISFLALFIELNVMLTAEEYQAFIQDMSAISVPIMSVVMLVVFLLHYFMLTLVYGWMARKFAEKQLAAG